VVTPDGGRAISASIDKTLKVWDLATCQCLATHRGDTSFTAVAATTTMICAGDVAGTLWFLDWPASWKPLQPAFASSHEPATPKITTKRLRERGSRASRALGNGRSVGNAVEQAVATLAAKQLPDEHLPRCRTRDGVDADQVVLGALA